MRRAPGDNTWNYVRIYPNIRPSIHMEPLGNGSFECIYLKSHPGLSTSDSDFPALGSWRSKDVFVPHPTMPDVWKYVMRLDDRVTLNNGEKVLPLPIEGRIRQDDLVREAVVVGVDRAIPGVLLFRSDNQDAESLPEAEFVEKVWLSIVDANTSAEAFSQITREMVLVLPPGTEYPKTDKGSIIRAQVYRKFADQIEDMYTRLDRESSGTLRLDLAGIEKFLADLYADMFGIELEHSHMDFFTAGVDSLQAIQMRRKIQQALDLGGHQLGSNVVYEQGNIATLAKHLFSLSQGEIGQGSGNIVLMKDLISKYSIFESSQIAVSLPFRNIQTKTDTCQILTGATGSLGAHILSQMVQSPKFHKVYCLVRGPNPMARILASIDERGLVLDKASLSKIVALTAEVHKPDLGVGSEQMALFRREVQCIVHLAWPVNFNIGLPSFEPHLEGLRNLIALSVSVERPALARLFFASSISTAERTPRPALIPDAPINDFSHALDMGYAQSKLAAEHIVLNAARNGARAHVLRIGQIVGDLQHGVWNDSEFIPSIIRSALSLGTLPGLPDECSWLPVDTLATAILELDETLNADKSQSFSDDSVFYNMVNPLVFQWSELLEQLRDAGLDFETISVREWVKELRNVAEKDGGVEAAQNPAVKLIHHFEQRYLSDGNVLAGNVVFDTKAVQRDTRVLQSPPDIIREGYVQSFIKTWMEKWAPEGPVLFNGAP